MSLNYATYVTDLSNLMVVDQTDPNFIQILPACIADAEQRMYRELDLLSTVTRDSSQVTTNSRNFTLPQNNGRFVVVNGINAVTPSSQTNPDTGTRNPLSPVSRDALDVMWPSSTGASVPQHFAMITDQLVILGPAPDATYTLEVIGTIRPTPLSADNSTTYLTLYLPDAFVAASMIFMSAYLKNFGSQADNPQMAVSWQSHYDQLMASANVEEQRKRFAAGAWGSLSPTPIASPNRDAS